MPDTDTALAALRQTRGKVAVALTAAMLLVYFGFILLVAFDKPLMAVTVTTGLSLGMLLGALVIVAAWVLTLIYIQWANSKYDAAVAAILSKGAVQ